AALDRVLPESRCRLPGRHDGGHVWHDPRHAPTYVVAAHRSPRLTGPAQNKGHLTPYPDTSGGGSRDAHRVPSCSPSEGRSCVSPWERLTTEGGRQSSIGEVQMLSRSILTPAGKPTRGRDTRAEAHARVTTAVKTAWLAAG